MPKCRHLLTVLCTTACCDVRAAKCVRDDRIRNDERSVLQVALDTVAKYPGYKLWMTGHSLGAGTAAVLTALINMDRNA